VQCTVETQPVCDPNNGSCGACTGHNGSNTPRACPTVPEPACLNTGDCVECTITGGNPNGNTVRCTGTKPICNDTTKKCVECTDDAHCPNGYCDLTNNKCVIGCQNNNHCDPPRPICDPDSKTCVPCTEDSHCPNGQVCENKQCVPVDAGVPDAGPTDAGTDSGITDAGSDAGDAGADAGDAGDGGTEAGVDAGDGGRDGGADGGRDGGVGPDGGVLIDEEEPFVDEYGIFGAGCDCNQALSSTPESSNLGRAAVLFGVALAFVARRRRSGRSASRRD
jgi:MYXO-CTERM domain-containing protein